MTDTDYIYKQTCDGALDINDLQANHYTVSVHKYGFFLCLAGKAHILLGKSMYELSEGSMCIYTPNTFFHILERSGDLHGILCEYGVDTFCLPVRIHLAGTQMKCSMKAFSLLVFFSGFTFSLMSRIRYR